MYIDSNIVGASECWKRSNLVYFKLRPVYIEQRSRHGYTRITYIGRRCVGSCVGVWVGVQVGV